MLSGMAEPATITCPYCGQKFEIAVDAAGGPDQLFTSDCEVCCRPISFHVTISREQAVAVSAQAESDT